MMRAFRSEWYKLWRRGMVLGGLGTMAGIACLAVILLFVNAHAASAPVTPGGGPRDRALPTLEALALGNGMVVAFSFVGGILGVIALVLFAQVIGSEYREGTLKALLTREPRRLHLLAGKLAAMAAFVAVGVLAAFLLQSLVAALMAAARGVDTSAWWTTDALRNAAGLVARTWTSLVVRGLLGASIAIALRSSAPAIGVGIGYTLVGENLIDLIWTDGHKWLLGGVLDAFSAGGNALLTLGEAGALTAAYAALFLLTSGALFWRRDVTS